MASRNQSNSHVWHWMAEDRASLVPPPFSYNGTCNPVRGTQLQTPPNCPRDSHGQIINPSDSCAVCCYWRIVEGVHHVCGWMAMGPTRVYLMHREEISMTRNCRVLSSQQNCHLQGSNWGYLQETLEIRHVTCC